MAACYGNITSDNVEHLDEDDADALEAAFDKSFTAAPAIVETAPKADDPLDLDAAFDAAFHCDANDPAESSEATCPAESSSEGDDSRGGVAPSDAGSGNLTDADDDDDDDADGDAGRTRRRVAKMRASALFTREGKNVVYGGKILGIITGWNGSVSCACRTHGGKCKSPASKAWGSDEVLESWLLEAVGVDGVQCMDKDTHIQRVGAIAARIRLSR
jgi:hypothetical protein